MSNFQSIAGAAMWALMSGLLAFAALTPVPMDPEPAMAIAAAEIIAPPAAA